MATCFNYKSDQHEQLDVKVNSNHTGYTIDEKGITAV